MIPIIIVIIDKRSNKYSAFCIIIIKIEIITIIYESYIALKITDIYYGSYTK